MALVSSGWYTSSFCRGGVAVGNGGAGAERVMRYRGVERGGSAAAAEGGERQRGGQREQASRHKRSDWSGDVSRAIYVRRLPTDAETRGNVPLVAISS